jgi:hypothetical protein
MEMDLSRSDGKSAVYLMQWMLARDNVLTPTRTIRPSVKLLYQWTQDIMVLVLSRSDSQRM